MPARSASITTGRQPVRLLPKAGNRVELGARNYDSSATLDGRPSVGLPIFQLPGGNALETAEAVQAKMKALRADPSWPTGMEYAIVFNPTTFVEDSVYEVVKTLFCATK